MHLLRQALNDAIKWQKSIIDSWGSMIESAPNKKRVEEYRALLHKLGGAEPRELGLDVKTISLPDLRKKHEGK